MDEKRLQGVDIEKRSDKLITDGRVSQILQGQGNNPTLKIILGLAKGLDVDPCEVLRAAADLPPHQPAWDVNSLLRAMEKVVDNSELTKLLQVALKQKPAKIRAILKSLESEKD
jgi:hypothetical protein